MWMEIGAGAVIVAGIAAYTSRARRRRFHRTSNPPTGFEPTDEFVIDPTTGVRQQVWYNQETGQRHYQTMRSAD